ncbi:MAG: translation elongation factor EF1A/initiation factor IF2gamma [Benniella sp.]|nr:MAG: translation elongation factor EF1A/initiation factor IF2gamma [Benniella sp.]
MIGFVLCSPKHPVHEVSKFEVQLGILDYKNIICAGYAAELHIHNATEEKTGRKSNYPPQFLKKSQQGIVMIETSGPLCVETFTDSPRLGHFTLRDEGKTIAIGKVTKLHFGTDLVDCVGSMKLVGRSALKRIETIGLSVNHYLEAENCDNTDHRKFPQRSCGSGSQTIRWSQSS